MKTANNHSSSSLKTYYVPVPDNEDAFFAFVNLVINNKQNVHVVGTSRPKKIGPYKVNYANGDNNELFIEASDLKMKCFIEMIIDQFTLLRTYWTSHIVPLVRYPNQDIY